MEYKDYKAYADSLLSERDTYKWEFEERARMVLPTSWAEMQKQQGAELPTFIRYSEEANEACQLLASAHMQMLTPFDVRWFNIDLQSLSSAKLGDDAETFQSKASEKMWAALAKSNFTSAINAFYLDRCGIGHAALHVRMSETGQLVFTHIPAGTFGVAFSETGICDTLVREYKLTAAQVVKRWGENVHEKIMKAYRDPKRRFTEEFNFLHIVMPNAKGQKGSRNRAVSERPFSEVIMCKDIKDIMEENGLYEFPFLVTRFLKWGKCPYGTAPASMCRSSIIRLEKTERVLDIIGELAVEPPMVIDEKSTGMVNMMPGGITPIKPDMRPPQMLAKQGNYNIGLDRIQRAEKKIKGAFYSDIVKPLAGIEHDMTATEVRARQSENIVSFVHSFSMVTTEMVPFIRAVFSMLYRYASVEGDLGDDGLMPSIPDELKDILINVTQDGKDIYFSELEISFTSRLAMALKEISLDGDIQAMKLLAELMQLLGMPHLVDNINVDKAFRDGVRGMNASTTLLRPQEEVEKIRKARAEAQAQEAQMMANQQQAVTNKDNAQAEAMLQRGGAA